MSFNSEATRRISEAVRVLESTKKPQKPAQPPRVVLPNRNAVTVSSIGARSGLTKGFGYVHILCDDGTGTGTDYIIEHNVKIWNPYTNQINSEVYITLKITDGLLQVEGASCPSSS